MGHQASGEQRRNGARETRIIRLPRQKTNQAGTGFGHAAGAACLYLTSVASGRRVLGAFMYDWVYWTGLTTLAIWVVCSAYFTIHGI
jgi:hypothetical protein